MKGCTLPASVLATVLVVCTLILLGVSCVMMLWHRLFLQNEEVWQDLRMQACTESAFVLYCMDSTLPEQLDKDTTLLLFEEEPFSRMVIKRHTWGLYEVVEVADMKGKYRSIRLLGKCQAGRAGAELSVADRGQMLGVAGKSGLDGKLMVPEGKLHYTRMREEFFEGEKPAHLEKSTPQLEVPVFLRDKQEEGRRVEVDNRKLAEGIRWSFARSPLCLTTGSLLQGVDIRGHVLLYNADSLSIGGDCHLENVIVVAPVVRIGDRFQGSLQVFARDSALIGDDVILKEGSGVMVEGESPCRYIRLGERSVVHGFVIAGKGKEGKKITGPHYSQAATARVKGLVYVDGIADLQGEIEGSVFATQCYHFAPEGYYANMLYALQLKKLPGGGYPLFMEGPYERRVLKWLE